MPPPLSHRPVPIGARRRKDPLPRPLRCGVRQLPGNATLPPPAARSSPCRARTRSRCAARLGRMASGSTVTRSTPPFPRRIRISPPLQVHVLDPQGQALEQAHPTSIQQRPHQPIATLELPQDPRHFRSRQHDRQPRRRPRPRQLFLQPECPTEDLRPPPVSPPPGTGGRPSRPSPPAQPDAPTGDDARTGSPTRCRPARFAGYSAPAGASTA